MRHSPPEWRSPDREKKAATRAGFSDSESQVRSALAQEMGYQPYEPTGYGASSPSAAYQKTFRPDARMSGDYKRTFAPAAAVPRYGGGAGILIS